jgi:adenylyltransferase/sulfurtransferase
LRDFALVVDGTDNFRTRYRVNDACVLLGVPNVYASVLRFDGQISVLATPNGPCYRCLYPAAPPPGSVPSCAEAGVLGVLPGLLGMLQATEAIKLILGRGEPLIGRLLLIDALASQFTRITVPKDPTCVACGTRELRELADYEAFCAGPAAAQHSAVPRVTALELESWRANGRVVALLDVREKWEWDVGHIAGATLVPMSQLERAAPSLDPSADTVVYCHHGVRSRAAAQWLRSLGFRRIYDLAGGIDAWSVDVDPDIPRY